MKKLICILLTLILCLGSFAVAVAAEESAEADISTDAPVTSESEATSSEAESTPPVESTDSSEESTVPEDSSAPEDSSSPEESTPPEDSSVPEGNYWTVTVYVTGGGVTVTATGVTTEVKTSSGETLTFSVLEGSDVTFTVAPETGKVVGGLSVVTGNQYAIDPTAGTVVINAVHRAAEIDVSLTDASAALVEISNISDASWGTVSYEQRDYFVGEELALTLAAAEGYGIKAVAVNGTPVPLGSDMIAATVSIPVTETTSVTVEFSRLCDVSINCQGGGTYYIQEVEVVSGFLRLPAGRAVTMIITPNAGMAVDCIRLNNSGAVRYGVTTYSLVVEQNELVDIIFYENSSFTITPVVDGVGGQIFPDRPTSVERGENVEFNFVPDDGYEIDLITVNGQEWTITGTTLTITNINANKTVTVSFRPIDQSGDQSSETESEVPEDSSAPVGGETEFNYLTVADIQDLAGNTDIYISIAQKSKIGKDALLYLNTLLSDTSKTVYIGEDGKYWWVVPGGASFDTAGLDNSGVDFTVLVDEGEYCAYVKSKLQEKVDQSAFYGVANLYIERASAAELPQGTSLKVNAASAFTVGDRVEWLKYDPISGQPSAYAPDELFAVDNDGWIRAYMPGNNRYGAFLSYVAPYSAVTVKYNGSMCGFDSFGTVTVGEGGLWQSVLYQKSGTDFELTVYSKGGYCIESITVSGYTNMVLLDENGTDITATGAAGVSGDVVIKISGIASNGEINVTMAEKTAEPPTKNVDSGVSLEVIFLIAIIAIVMVGGGVFFILKWRQSNDDDDEDFEDYED